MKQYLSIFIAMSLFTSSSAQAKPLDVGSQAPRIPVRLDDGSSANLGDFYDKGLTFIFFYPKADTPGCTAQACSLRDSYSELTSRGVQVIGVSTDSTDAQARFRSKHNLPYPLVADGTKSVIEAFGVPTTMGFAKRTAFLIQDGKIAWMDASASTKHQAADLLAALDTIQSQEQR